MTKRKPPTTSRAKGRPPKGAAPALPAEEVDRLLVFGEVVTCDDGSSQTVIYPSYRDLAERFGVSTTLIALYSKEHNCVRRREQAKARIQVQADQKLVELRSTAVALSKDDELRMIDTYLLGFEKALSEGRVRFDNPSDFNAMIRLKEFVMGGADSRQEIHASLSLEDIQARHQRMIRVAGEASPVVRGELSGPTSGMVIDVEPPRGPTEGTSVDLNVHLDGQKTGLSQQRLSKVANVVPVLGGSVRTCAPSEEGNGSAAEFVTSEKDGGYSEVEATMPADSRALLQPADAAAHQTVTSTATKVNAEKGVHFSSADTLSTAVKANAEAGVHFVRAETPSDVHLSGSDTIVEDADEDDHDQ